MPDLGILQVVGAPPKKPTHYYPITTQTFFSGLRTQRSPFNGPTSRYEARFLGSRTDMLIDGLNMELTNYGTMIRRPGLILFSTATVATPILGFYSFRQIKNVPNPIDVIVDTASAVYNVTPTAATVILNKANGAGKCFFQGVGNTLYMGDGVDLVAWTDGGSTRKWGISIGDFSGASGPNICSSGSDVPVTGGAAWSSPGNITAEDGTYASANAGSIASTSTGPNAPKSATQIGGGSSWGNVTAVEGTTSTATTSLPAGGSSTSIVVTNFGFSIPANAIILGVAASVSREQTGGTSAVYDSVVQLVGVNGSANRYNASPWPSTLTAQTYGGSNDLWGLGTSLTPAVVNSSAFGLSFSCDCTGAPGNGASAAVNGFTLTVYYQVPAANQTDYLQATGFNFNLSTQTTIQGIQVQIKGYQPSNPNGSYLNVQLLQGGVPVGNTRIGIQLPSSNGYVTLGGQGDFWGANWSATSLSTSNFGVRIQGLNTASNSVATWYIDVVKVTIWATGGPPVSVSSNSGSFSATSGYQYVVAYGNSNSGHVSTATPPSAGTGPFNNSAGVNVTLTASTDPQVNQIWVFRTTDGGSTFFNLPTSPYPNTSQVITDSANDTSLNITQQAPLAHANDPPPSGLTKFAYHAGRVWGVVGNIVYFSGGPDTLLGNGAEAFPPANYFVFPTQVNRLVPTANGLLVFTQSDLYIIVGTNIPTFYVMPYTPGLGLLSYNALDIQGSNIFLYTADRQFIQWSSAGINEAGFVIGNLLESSFDPTKVYVAAIIAGTSEKAVYIADGVQNWFRCNWNQPPEGGPAWSPKATISAGFTAMQSVETSPGQHQLLLGMSNGQIAARSMTTFTDLGNTYSAYMTVGSVVLAQPGQLAEISSITAELQQVGSIPTVSVLLDEINGNFETLNNYVADPPVLTPSQSIMSNRFYLLQGNDAVVCRHLQIKLSFPAEAARNELLTLSIWGALLAQE